MKFPVVIEKGKTTSVHLDGNPWSPTPRASDGQLVFLPNGAAAGWKSPAP